MPKHESDALKNIKERNPTTERTTDSELRGWPAQRLNAMSFGSEMRKRLVVAFALLLAVSPAIAQAKCESGSSPDYNDIEAVMLKQDGCGGTQPPNPPTTFDCSTFYAVFWDSHSMELARTYFQYNLPGAVGTYNIGASLKQVQEVLREDDFFALSPPEVGVTDTTKSVLSVKRCAVITRIVIENGLEEPAVRRLFSDLRMVIEHSSKTKISATVTDFKETLLFDP